jgi:hypothetical protein
MMEICAFILVVLGFAKLLIPFLNSIYLREIFVDPTVNASKRDIICIVILISDIVTSVFCGTYLLCIQ